MNDTFERSSRRSASGIFCQASVANVLRYWSGVAVVVASQAAPAATFHVDELHRVIASENEISMNARAARAGLKGL